MKTYKELNEGLKDDMGDDERIAKRLLRVIGWRTAKKWTYQELETYVNSLQGNVDNVIRVLKNKGYTWNWANN